MDRFNWISVEEKLPPDTKLVWAYGSIQPEPTMASYHAEEKEAAWHVQPFKNSWYWTTKGIHYWLPIEAAIQPYKGGKALTLLTRLIDENDPFINDDPFSRSCFFCREDHPNHAEDCIYLEAKRLLDTQQRLTY